MNKLLANAFRSAADDAYREGKISSDQKHVYYRSGSYCYVMSKGIHFITLLTSGIKDSKNHKPLIMIFLCKIFVMFHSSSSFST